MGKESQGNTTVHRFPKVIRFYTQRENGANTTCIWSPQKTVTSIRMLLKSTKGMVHSPDGDRHLQYCCWRLAKRYISTIFVYTLYRLCTLNIHQPCERTWFHIKKKQQVDNILLKLTDADLHMI